MRIISGSHRGRLIRAPAGLPVRPTTDMAKEALFNILRLSVDFEEARVLDLFAGTGNISYEFASRGAREVVAVDMHAQCAGFIRKMAQTLDFSNLRVVRADVFHYLKSAVGTWDVIFADPPYEMTGTSALPDIILERDIIAHDGIMIIEHGDNVSFSGHQMLSDCRNYGKVRFSFFQNKA